MEETSGERRLLGAIWLLASIVSIGAALLLQPFSDWGVFTTVLAILVVIMGITGAWTLATGKGRVLNSRLSVKSQRILSIIGLVAATILAIGYLVSDWANWTAQDALTIGIWIAIGAMFAESLVMMRDAS
jgi:hypothetical protein